MDIHEEFTWSETLIFTERISHFWIVLKSYHIGENSCLNLVHWSKARDWTDCEKTTVVLENGLLASFLQKSYVYSHRAVLLSALVGWAFSAVDGMAVTHNWSKCWDAMTVECSVLNGTSVTLPPGLEEHLRWQDMKNKSVRAGGRGGELWNNLFSIM